MYVESKKKENSPQLLWTSDYYVFPILPFSDLEFLLWLARLCHTTALWLSYESLLQKGATSKYDGKDCLALRDLGLQ